MAIDIVSSLVATLLLAGASIGWRNRGHVRLLRAAVHRNAAIRVSCGALLRVKDDDRYVLVALASRPNFFGPPGGVFKHRADATDDLDAVGFRAERHRLRRDEMFQDLRGFVPARSLVRFIRWFHSDRGRESAAECLRRELAEELGGQLGDPTLTNVNSARFRSLRTVMEGPAQVRGGSMRQFRRLEVFDLSVDDEPSARVRQRLVQLADDPAAPHVLGVTSAEIMSGWCDHRPIAPHTGYLLGGKRLQPDLQPMPDA